MSRTSGFCARTCPTCSVCVRKDGYFGRRLKLNVGYSKYCSAKCAKSDPGYWMSVRDGCIRNHGVEYPLQDPEILRSSRHRYMFDGIGFDSSSELVAYVFFRDNVDAGVVRNEVGFPYSFGGKEYFYVPDLYLPSKKQYVEVKGRQFLAGSGTMRQVWAKPGATEEDKAAADARQDARRACMEENGIKLVARPVGRDDGDEAVRGVGIREGLRETLPGLLRPAHSRMSAMTLSHACAFSAFRRLRHRRRLHHRRPHPRRRRS